MHMEKLAIGDQLQFKGPLGEYTFSEASPTFSKVRLRLRLKGYPDPNPAPNPNPTFSKA